MAVTVTGVSAQSSLGANYTHWELGEACVMSGHGIIATYDQPGIRDLVRSQLASMQISRITSLRTIIWHMHEVKPWHDWGVIPSKRGLVNPYKTNLSRFIDDVKAFGVTHLTIAMGPMWANDPGTNVYNPSLLDENWRMIQDVRMIVKARGPADTKMDLCSECAPTVYQPGYANLMTYLPEIWKRYVSRYGTSDASISFVSPWASGGATDRLPNLIQIFGKRQPAYFEMHLGAPTAQLARSDLQYVDDVLTQSHLSQPFNIGETYYEDSAIADGIRLYSGAHRIVELMEWPITSDGTCVSPPYTVNVYTN
jgi:hypothetical protein